MDDAHRPRRRFALGSLSRTRAVVLGVLAALLVVGALLFEWNWLRGPIERIVTWKTGRSFDIGGDLDVELGRSARRPRVWQELLRVTDLRTLEALAEGLCGFGVPEPRGDGAETLARFVKAATAHAPDLAEALAGEAEPPSKKPKSPSPAWSSALKLAQDRLKIDDRWISKALGLLEGFAAEFRRDYVAQG